MKILIAGAGIGGLAAAAYDAAKLIDGAIKLVGGKINDKDALRTTLRRAPFKSVRGEFRYNKNHFPIQNYFLAKAMKDDTGKFQTSLAEMIFTERGDQNVAACKMSW